MNNPVPTLRGLARRITLLVLLVPTPWAAAWELDGTKTLSMLTRDQQLIPIGTVEFAPLKNSAAGFTLRMDSQRFTDHFLSMKEFKCLEGGDEVLCHVPYPYRTPGVISKRDYAWLEHNLLFLYKQPRDFGAKLWNGLYFRLEADGEGLVGYPQAVDLNLISAPPDDLTIPPYDKSQRDDVAKGAHWIERLVIR
jgi:hypothetical protein